MKKLFVIILVILLVSAAGGGIYVYLRSRQANIVSPEASEWATTTPASQELATWEDPAGFTFDYPKDISVNKHDEDSQNYAHIELTHKDHPGTIIIWAKDTAALDAASWVKAEKSLSGGTVFDTSLGAISGKKVLITTPKKIVVSGIVDEGVVFYIEGVFEESEYWTKAYDVITTSFAFVVEEQSSQSPGAGVGEEAIDEEEIIE